MVIARDKRTPYNVTDGNFRHPLIASPLKPQTSALFKLGGTSRQELFKKKDTPKNRPGLSCQTVLDLMLHPPRCLQYPVHYCRHWGWHALPRFNCPLHACPSRFVLFAPTSQLTNFPCPACLVLLLYALSCMALLRRPVRRALSTPNMFIRLSHSWSC